MTVSYYAVEVRLGNHLRSLSGVPPISWDATPFTPPRALWLRPTMIPNIPDQLFVGAGPSAVRGGVYRIGVFGPPGSGLKAVSEMADRIINHFEQVQVLDPGTLNIHIDSAWRSPAVTEAEWYQVPVSVSFTFIT